MEIKRLVNPVGKLPFKKLKEVEKALLIYLLTLAQNSTIY